jgi:site-specific DNA-methyltransferase (adenine-specific)
MSEKPYYEDENVVLYNADCLEHTDLWDADVMVTDPPYGIKWRNHWNDTEAKRGKRLSKARGINIANDEDTSVFARALDAWGKRRPALVFASPKLIPPETKQILVWWKNGGIPELWGR